MTQEEILDYNKLCAEFLGWEYIDKDQHSQAYENYGWWVKRIYHNNIDARNNCNWKGFNQNLKFHSDWNWLMEVVEKKIEAAQNRHDSEAENLTNEYNRKMAELDAQLDHDRTKLEETIVNEILSKII